MGLELVDVITIGVATGAVIVSIIALCLSNTRQKEANTIASAARRQSADANAIAKEAKGIALRESHRAYRAGMHDRVRPASKALSALVELLQKAPGRGVYAGSLGEIASEAFGALGSARAFAGAETCAGRCISHAIKLALNVLEIVATYRSVSPEGVEQADESERMEAKRIAETSLASLRFGVLTINSIPTLPPDGEEVARLERDLAGLSALTSRRIERLSALGFRGVLLQNEETLVPRMEE